MLVTVALQNLTKSYKLWTYEDIYQSDPIHFVSFTTLHYQEKDIQLELANKSDGKRRNTCNMLRLWNSPDHETV